MVSEVFNAGMTSISKAQTGKYTDPLNLQVEDYFYGTGGISATPPF